MREFTRISWTSEEARATWSPRLDSARLVFQDLQTESVRCGLRNLCLLNIPTTEIARYRNSLTSVGLDCIELYKYASRDSGSYLNAALPDPSGTMCVLAVGQRFYLDAAKVSFQSSDSVKMGRLLGYPSCCIEFFRVNWGTGKSIDLNWEFAQNSTIIKADADKITLRINALTNVFLRHIGIRPVFHLPCSLDCEGTAVIAKDLALVVRTRGYEQEQQYIEQILSLPIRWSSLHGIAEIETPIFRICASTDRTERLRLINLLGTTEGIEHCAKGSRFPYVLQSEVRGRRNQTAVAKNDRGPNFENHHFDFGFSSREALERACKPIVQEVLSLEPKSVLHLFCKNGALLHEIQRVDPAISVKGVNIGEVKPYQQSSLNTQVNHATVALNDPSFTDGLEPADVWVLMGGRLVEIGPLAAVEIVNAAKQKCRALILYSFSDWLQNAISTINEVFKGNIEPIGKGIWIVRMR